MLSPEYLDECSNQLINLYSELENRIIADIVRRLLKTGDITETAKWEILKAQELGLLYDDVLSLIASQTDATSNHVKALFEDAGVETVNIDNEKYRKMGKTPIDIRQSDSMKQVLEAGYQKTLGNLQNLTMTTAITSQTTFINASNSAYMMVTSGAFSYQDAIRTAIKEMAQKGVSVLTDTIKYEGTNKKGQHYTHEDKIDVAVRRNVLTGVGQTCKQVSLTNAKENGFDLMEINAHSGARPSHAKWQGKRVSLSGRKGYLSLHDIGFGSAEGFGGCNCRHDWYPVDENDIPMYTDSQLQDFDAKNIEYNGKKYTQYEATQIQRRKEREIRDLKREAVAYDTAIKETDDEELKSKLKDDFTKTSKKLKDKEKALADFTKETGIKRDRFREQVQGFNRSVSSKSTWVNKKSRNDLTSAQNSGNISIENDILKISEDFDSSSSISDSDDFYFEDYRYNFEEEYLKNVPKKHKKALLYASDNCFSYARDDENDNNLIYAYSEKLDAFLYNTLHPNFKKYDFNTTYSHELSHYLDYHFFKSFENEAFIKSIEENTYPVQHIENYLNKYSIDLNNLKENMEISDILSAITLNDMNLMIGHETSYWQRKRNREKEIFVNLFNLEIQDKQNTLNFVKEAFPDIWGAYLNIKNIGFSQLELED